MRLYEGTVGWRKMELRHMRTIYEVHSGRHVVSRREAGSALEALIEHLRSLGCRDQDIIRLGTQAVSWRGAVYRAVQAP